jgi:hypothetical protein
VSHADVPASLARCSYSSISARSEWGCAGVALFFLSAAVGAGLSSTRKPAAGAASATAGAVSSESTADALYLRVPLLGPVLKVDLFHYLLAAAELALALALVRGSVIRPHIPSQ